MDDYNWEDLLKLYDSCLALPEKEREVFLVQNTASKPELRARLLEMLAQTKESDDYFDDLIKDIAKGFEGELPDLAKPGDVINNYKIIEKIGVGGSSQVYVASRVDGQFDKKVAVKIFKKKDLGSFTNKSENEKQFLASLSHPSIAQIFDGGSLDNGHPFIIMELVEGETLHKYLKNKKLTETDCLHMFSEICGSVREAHNNLILHLDIKPANIVVAKDQRIKLLDFGIAQRLKEKITDENISKLTFNFAAPEQFTGKLLSVQTDIYQLGLIFYYLLSNGQILEGEKQVKVFLESTNSKPIFSKELLSIVKKCLNQDPENRYQSVDQLLTDIWNYQHKYPISTYSKSGFYKVKKYVQRNSIATLLLLLVFLSLIGGTIVSLRQAQIAKAEKEKAEKERKIAENVKYYMFSLFEEADPSFTLGDTINIYDFLETSFENIEEFGGGAAVKTEMYSVLGQTFAALHDMKKATEALKKAKLYGKQLKYEYPRSYITYLYFEAIMHRERGYLDSAALTFSELKNTYFVNKLDRDSILATSLIVFSNIQRKRGKLDSAYSLITEAIELEKTIHPNDLENLYIVQMELVKGSIETDLYKFEDAKKTVEKALSLCISLVGNNHPGVSIIYDQLSEIYAETNRVNEAIFFKKKSYLIDSLIYQTKGSKLATANYKLARLYNLKSQMDSANYYIAQSYSLFNANYGTEPNQYFAAMLHVSGNILNKQAFYDSAETSYIKSIEMLHKIEQDKVPLMAENFYYLSQNYIAKKDTSHAVMYLDSSRNVYESLENDKKVQNINGLLAKIHIGGEN